MDDILYVTLGDLVGTRDVSVVGTIGGTWVEQRFCKRVRAVIRGESAEPGCPMREGYGCLLGDELLCALLDAGAKVWRLAEREAL